MQLFSLQQCIAPPIGFFANLQSVADHPDKDLIEHLIEWSGRTASGLAKGAGLSASTLTRPLNFPVKHRLSIPTLAKLREAYPDFPGWQDRSRVRSEVASYSPDALREKYGDRGLPPIEVVGSAVAMVAFDPDRDIELIEVDLGEVFDHVPRPQSLEHDHRAYAVTIVGDSMVPRFRPGRRVIVSPRAPVSIGDDVIVQLRGAEGDGEYRDRVALVLVKELVKNGPQYIELRQYNPDVTFQVPRERVASIHKVMGEVF